MQALSEPPPDSRVEHCRHRPRVGRPGFKFPLPAHPSVIYDKTRYIMEMKPNTVDEVLERLKQFAKELLLCLTQRKHSSSAGIVNVPTLNEQNV